MSKVWSLSTLCLLALLTWGVCGQYSKTPPRVSVHLNLFTRPAPICHSPYVPTDHLWEVRMTTDKGRGVFARVDIPRGTRVMLEDPLVLLYAPVLEGKGASLEALKSQLAEQFSMLTTLEKRKYLSCHEVRFGEEGKDEDEGSDMDNIPTGRLIRIFRSNAYSSVDWQAGLYPHVALINHDCHRPNVLNIDHQVVSKSKEFSYKRLVLASRDIAAGEELLTTYIPLLDDTAFRRRRLAQYGFTCMCEACAAASPEDDAERVRMGEEYYVLRDLTQSPYFDEMDDDDDDETIAAKMSIWREKMRAPLERAVKLATYIQERGFADYALETSGFAYNFANWAHDKEALKYWGDVLEDISLMQSYESKW